MVDNHLTIPVSTTDEDADLVTSPFNSTLTTNPFHSIPNPGDTVVPPAPSPSVLIPIRDTRVMSPSNEQQCVPYQRQPYQWHCQVCQMVVATPVTCSHCGTYGHGTCLRLEQFQGLQFCGNCMTTVIVHYSNQCDQQLREEWKRTYIDQLATWKARAVNALGVSSVMGAAVGGVAVTVAEAAVGFASGAVAAVAASTTRGRDTTQRALTDGPTITATTTIALPQLPSPGPQEVIPPPPQPIAPTPKRRMRPQSADGRPNPRITMSPSRAKREGHCLACHTSNKGHHPHLRAGDCVGFPGRTYYATHDSDEGRSFHSAEIVESAST